jgi:hypothetical protein
VLIELINATVSSVPSGTLKVFGLAGAGAAAGFAGLDGAELAGALAESAGWAVASVAWSVEQAAGTSARASTKATYNRLFIVILLLIDVLGYFDFKILLIR